MEKKIKNVFQHLGYGDIKWTDIVARYMKALDGISVVFCMGHIHVLEYQSSKCFKLWSYVDKVLFISI